MFAYKHIIETLPLYENTLNRLGNEGWELISYFQDAVDNKFHYMLKFINASNTQDSQIDITSNNKDVLEKISHKLDKLNKLENIEGAIRSGFEDIATEIQVLDAFLRE
ncbi:MAG: hypothetical protein V1765_03385 [bacterium]